MSENLFLIAQVFTKQFTMIM